ncbi:MAG TPA: Lrp/AsnC family transcriptional regulator [Candidatus Bathyarchaeia archaeon]|nr:Lrp/AsnC family transcriptional regulator [Candidatus Bathyarchaeia archaeon]
MKIDEVDLKILHQLTTDCRMSYRQIAKNARISVGTALNRVRRLEKAGVIRGYSAIVDHEKIGYDLTVITEITVSRGKLVEIEKAVSKLPNACAVYDVTGLTDAIVIAKFHNREELSKFTKGLLGLSFITRTNTRVVLQTIKEDFRLT